MLRKMAIALIAASVFTAPVLAQNNNTLSGGANNKNQPATSTPSGESLDKSDKTEKTEKSAENVEKAGKAGKHHRMARHHRKTGTTMGKLHTHTAKFARTESRRVGRGRIVTKHVYGKTSKHMPSTTGMGHH